MPNALTGVSRSWYYAALNRILVYKDISLTPPPKKLFCTSLTTNICWRNKKGLARLISRVFSQPANIHVNKSNNIFYPPGIVPPWFKNNRFSIQRFSKAHFSLHYRGIFYPSKLNLKYQLYWLLCRKIKVKVNFIM